MLLLEALWGTDGYQEISRTPAASDGGEDHIMTVATRYLGEHLVLFLSRFSALQSWCIWSAPPRVVMAGKETALWRGEGSNPSRPGLPSTSNYEL